MPYRILIALDSFKGSLSSLQACQALESGLHTAFINAHIPLECILLPISDGGEGLLDAIQPQGISSNASTYQDCFVEVTSPYGKRIKARYLLREQKAILEMAQSTGLTLTPAHERRAKYATSYGLGEMIAHAYAQGAREIILGVGGSASNDAGAGCIQALGVRFYNAKNELLDFAMSGGRLNEIARIENHYRLDNLNLHILCDVNNPLLGAQGATFVYGQQKGVQKGDLEFLESQIQHFADLFEHTLGGSWRSMQGSGAAGGVVFSLRALCNAQIQSGAHAVLELTRAKEHIAQADLVITGEGCLDSQSAFGKAPIALARLAHSLGKPCIGVAGTLGKGYTQLHKENVLAMFSLINAPMSLESAMSHGSKLLQNLGREIGGLLTLSAKV